MKKLLTVFLTLAIVGCSTQTFYVNGQSSTTLPTEDASQTFFISGIGQKKSIDAAEICNGAENVVKVESQQSVLNIVFSAITFGIYTPRQAKVFCSQY